MSSIYFIALPLLFGFAVPILSRFGRDAVAYTSTLMQIFLFGLAISLWGSSEVEVIAINPPLGISLVVNSISILFVTLFTFLMMVLSIYYLSMRIKRPYHSEKKFFILINMLLASSIGLVMSSDIFNIYVFFEIAGITAYILSAYQKSAKALEAGIKYLITGMIASIFLVFAIALIYIHLGSLNLATISQNFSTLPYDTKLIISMLLFVGFGFKVEIFPLNFWVTDVYEGSSTLVNGLFSSIVVKAYLFVFFHIFYLFLPSGLHSSFLMLVGAVTMIVAEIVALKQTNLKRLFAYSSLGQVGFIFSTLALESSSAVTAAIFIVIAHSIAKMAIFLTISIIEHNRESVDISTLRHIKSPFVVVVMIVAMVSLLGLPPLLGFTGKFLSLKSFAMSGEFGALAIIIIASVIESVYYFKLVGLLLDRESQREPISISAIQKSILTLLIAILIVVGVAPWIISSYVDQSSHMMLDNSLYISTLLGAIR
jgi:proton-translocating NADH-quinone oxidoreductase chain N